LGVVLFVGMKINNVICVCVLYEITLFFGLCFGLCFDLCFGLCFVFEKKNETNNIEWKIPSMTFRQLLFH
jgi:hypothetical protein